MKSLYFNLTSMTILLLLIFGCKKKEPCAYDVPCVEQEPSGYMVGTMASDDNTKPKNQVATLYKTLHNSLAPIGDDWNSSLEGTNRVQSVFPKYWNSDSIGQVFGIALDHGGGVYFSATDVYKLDVSLPGSWGQWASGAGPAGAAGIYYTNYSTINTTIPLVTTLNSANANTVGTNQIPSTGFSTSIGNSIGNIAFDYAHNQLFVTNLEDGRIYRIDPANGKVKSILDPFALDDGLAGIAKVGEQIWGIGIYTTGGATKVYFARTTLPYNSTATNNGGVEIWSVALTASGEFSATNSGSGLYTATIASAMITKEVSVTQGGQNKVTDIAFSNAGKMLVAERGHPHRAGVFEYMNNGAAWVNGSSFNIGSDLTSNPACLYGRNAQGGVDYSEREMSNQNPKYACSDIVWATGTAMKTKKLSSYPNIVYGVQGMSSSGNDPSLTVNAQNDLYIDYNCTGEAISHIGAAYCKGKIGNVEFFDQTCSCKSK